MKNIYIVGIVVIVLVGGALLFFYNKQRDIVEMSKSQVVDTAMETTDSQPMPEVTQSKLPSQEQGVVSMTELAKHNSEADCWVGVDGYVYDVTSYVGKHPGGPSILQGCGKEASDVFGEKHGNKQRELLEQFNIGALQQ